MCWLCNRVKFVVPCFGSLRCLKLQKNADLIYTAAEARNYACEISKNSGYVFYACLLISRLKKGGQCCRVILFYNLESVSKHELF
jgi:hypothetical protein